MSWLSRFTGFVSRLLSPLFLNGSYFWLFLLFIPLLIFYFLKLKRPRQEVPSLAL